MSKVTVKVKFPGLDSLNKEKIVTDSFRKKLGKRVLKDVLDSIAVGKSPVRGQGRFKGYKVDRSAGEPASQLYPNTVKKKFPDKRKRPVNLKLNGDLLKAFGWKSIKGGIEFGLITTKEKLKKIFEAHNEGTNTKKKVPKRQLLPTGPKDKFIITIQRRIRNLYLARIRQLLSKAKRK